MVVFVVVFVDVFVAIVVNVLVIIIILSPSLGTWQLIRSLQYLFKTMAHPQRKKNSFPALPLKEYTQTHSKLIDSIGQEASWVKIYQGDFGNVCKLEFNSKSL